MMLPIKDWHLHDTIEGAHPFDLIDPPVVARHHRETEAYALIYAHHTDPVDSVQLSDFV